MKPSKKLALSRETVRMLQPAEMAMVAGGGFAFGPAARVPAKPYKAGPYGMNSGVMCVITEGGDSNCMCSGVCSGMNCCGSSMTGGGGGGISPEPEG